MGGDGSLNRGKWPLLSAGRCGARRANHSAMILLVTSSAKAQACSEAIQRATTETAQIATTFRRAATMLRAQEYSAVVIDESLLEREPAESETVLQHIGMAVPIHINFAISGIDRVVRELSAARYRRNKEIGISRQFAEQTLRNELKGTMTALLLSCEMALQVATLPPDAEARIRTAYLLAQEMRARIGIAA